MAAGAQKHHMKRNNMTTIYYYLPLIATFGCSLDARLCQNLLRLCLIS